MIDVLINWLIPSFIDWLTFNASLCSIVYNRQCVYTFHTLFCMVCIALYEFHIASFEIHYILHTKLYCTVESHYLELTLTVFVDNMKQITGPHVVFFILPYHNELEYFFIDSYKTMFIFFFIFATSLTLVITGSS